MKLIKLTLLVLCLTGLLATTAARADNHGGFHGGYRGGFHGGYYGGHVGVGVYVNPWPLLYPYAYYPYGVYPYSAYSYDYPPVVVQAAPTVYVEQGAAQPAPGAPVPTANSWYYCHKPEGYYPYVASCEGAWQRVPAQPPVQH